jgi:catechol 2,3-dioxygenase-like lactoylglutathione lyase family enzyme
MRILSLELWCRELDNLHQFYTQGLGLEMLENAPDCFSVQAGRSRLTFHQASADKAGRYHVAFDIPENQFDPAFAWLQARVPPAANAEGRTIFNLTHWNATSVYFFDPAGNILELIARHSQPTASHNNFSASSLVSISEFGIALQDVRIGVQSVTDQMAVEVYDGEGSDTFSAVGDELGLLIMARRGRIWMPDAGFPADYYPFTLQVQVQTGRQYTLSAPPSPLEIR